MGASSLGRLNYYGLQRALIRATLLHMVGRGWGGPLVFLWAMGCGAYTVPFTAPLMAGSLRSR